MSGICRRRRADNGQGDRNLFCVLKNNSYFCSPKLSSNLLQCVRIGNVA